MSGRLGPMGQAAMLLGRGLRRAAVGGVAALAAMAALSATAAVAATPFTAGPGRQFPNVAVGSDGTGHVAWITNESVDRVGYCRVPAGGSACDRSESLSFPNHAASSGNADSAQVFTPTPNKVVVFAGCYLCGAGGFANRVYRWTSTNNGQSFGAPTYLGEADIDEHAALLSADGLLAPDDEYLHALPNPAGNVKVATQLQMPFDQEVAPVGSRFVAVAHDRTNIRFARYSGPAPPTNAQLNTEANWTNDQNPLAADEPGEDTSLATGTNGLYLFYYSLGAGVRARLFNPATGGFGDATTLPRESPADDFTRYPQKYLDAAGDATGRLHVIWSIQYDGGRLRYSRSDDGGSTFGAPGTLAKGEDFLHVRVAAGPDGRGFAVWGSIGELIRVVALDPQPEPQPQQPAPEPAPLPGPAPLAPAPAPAPSAPPSTTTRAPAAYTGPIRKLTTNGLGAAFTLGLPRNCLMPRQAFVATLSARRIQARFVKLISAAFSFGAARPTLDRAAPFRATLRMPASAKPGALSTVAVRTQVRLRGGKSATTTVRGRVTACH